MVKLFSTNVTPILGAIGAEGLLLAASICLFVASLALFLAARRRMSVAAAQLEAAHSAANSEEGVSSKVLRNSDMARSTLMKIATYQDADALRDIAVRETAQMLGAVAAYLFRHDADGSTPLVATWFESPSYDRLSPDAPIESESPDYLDSHAYISYRRNCGKGGNAKWDALLGKTGTNAVLAAPIRVDGGTWGHVSYLLKRDGEMNDDDIARFNEACAIVQTGVARACVADSREEHKRQLAAAARATNRAARAKTLFLATMSHEIRTPLNALVGFSEFLNDPALTKDETAEYTAGIAQSANALLSLINDVLDLSKLETGKVDMSGRCDLIALFSELAGAFRYRAKAKSIEIASHISPTFPALQLSEEHVRQIMLNLVGNAVKYTDKGSVEWTAECRPDGSGTVALHISVKDTGCGIPPERLQTIFDPFKADDATRGGKAYTGSGLGLPIVKRLVDSCNGTIGIDSVPGKGTEVYLRIGHVPVAQADGDSHEPPAIFKIPDGFSVLIVDDVPVNLKVLALRVKKMGVSDITLAKSGEEALAALETKRPDVVLTDMWMPGMSGSDLAAAIRKTKVSADVPVIAVTADSDAKSSFDMSNFSGLVTKPVSVDKLMAVLSKAIRGRRAA